MDQAIRDIIDTTTDKEVLTDISDAALDRIEEIYKEEHSLSRYIKDRIGLEIPSDTNLIHGSLSNLLVYGHGYMPYGMAVELRDHISDIAYGGGPLCDIMSPDDSGIYGIVVYADQEDDHVVTMSVKGTHIPDDLDMPTRIRDIIDGWAMI